MKKYIMKKQILSIIFILSLTISFSQLVSYEAIWVKDSMDESYVEVEEFWSKIKEQAITKDQAIEQIIEILDIALMIRYQDTEQFESILRDLDNGDQVVDIFKNQIELIYF